MRAPTSSARSICSRRCGIIRRRTRFVFSSTGGVDLRRPATPPNVETFAKNPDSPYAIAKLAVEYYLAYYARIHGLERSRLRFGERLRAAAGSAWRGRRGRDLLRPHSRRAAAHRCSATACRRATTSTSATWSTRVRARHAIATTPHAARHRAFNVGTGVGIDVLRPRERAACAARHDEPDRARAGAAGRAAHSRTSTSTEGASRLSAGGRRCRSRRAGAKLRVVRRTSRRPPRGRASTVHDRTDAAGARRRSHDGPGNSCSTGRETQFVLAHARVLSLLSWAIMFGVWRRSSQVAGAARRSSAREVERASRLAEAGEVAKHSPPNAAQRAA